MLWNFRGQVWVVIIASNRFHFILRQNSRTTEQQSNNAKKNKPNILVCFSIQPCLFWLQLSHIILIKEITM